MNLGGGGNGAWVGSRAQGPPEAWDSNNPQRVALTRPALASPHKETRRVCVWLGLSKSCSHLSSWNLKHEPSYSEMCFIEAAIRCPGGTQERSVSWLKLCGFFFIFSSCLNTAPLLPAPSPPLCKDLSDMERHHLWHFVEGRLGLCPHCSGEKVEVQRRPVTFRPRFTGRLPTSHPGTCHPCCWSFLQESAPLPTFLSPNPAL